MLIDNYKVKEGQSEKCLQGHEMKKSNLGLGAQEGTLWRGFLLLRIENKVSQPVTEDRGSNCRLGLHPKSTEQNH